MEEEDIARFINERLSGKDLSHVGNVLTEIEAERDKMVTKINQSTGSTLELRHSVQQALSQGKTVTSSAQTTCELLKSTCDEALSNQTGNRKLLELAETMEDLNRAKKYMYWLVKLEEICTELEEAMDDSIATTIGPYTDFLKLYHLLVQSNCLNLRKAYEMAVEYWYTRIITELKSNMTSVLEALQWPNRPQQRPQNYGSSVAHFRQLFALMLDLRSPRGDDRPEIQLGDEVRSMVIFLIPLDVMLSPIRKRVRYHFSGKKETNRIDKPEWMFAYVMRQMKDHMAFLTKYVQPLLDIRGISMHIGVAFAYGIIQAVNERLQANMTRYTTSRDLLSHVIIESLSFESDLREQYCYPIKLDGSTYLFVDHKETFEKWLAFETEFALEQYNQIMDQPGWMETKYVEEGELDTLKPTSSAEAITRLLQAITERVKVLSNPPQQYEFIERITLKILESFLLEVMRGVHDIDALPTNEGIALLVARLNSINYIHTVINDWSNQLFFIQMQDYIDRPTNAKEPRDNWYDQSDGIFDSLLLSYNNCRSEIINLLITKTIDSLKSVIENYRKQKWLVPRFTHQSQSLDLSPGVCPFLSQLSGVLVTLKGNLAVPLFQRIWPLIAQSLSTYLFDMLILQNRFNWAGAIQLQTDMAVLYSLFNEYTTKPENYFKQVKDSVLLLVLNDDEMQTLKRHLTSSCTNNNSSHSDSIQSVSNLEKLGLHCLSPITALKVLDRFISGH